MFIQTETTPNPATLKFLPGRAVLPRARSTARRSAAERSPLAAKLFDMPAFSGVFFGQDFVTVTKTEGDWSASEARDPGRDHGALSLRRAGPGGDCRRPWPAPTSSSTPRTQALVVTIKELLETRVRPAVANDGGDITFRGFADGVVFLNMKGACAGCPSSTATLKNGIENLLRHFVPDVVEVRPV